MIVFERRGDLVFCLQFPLQTAGADYKIGCQKPGKYKVVLDSDDKLFGGFSRISHDVETVVVYALTEDSLKATLTGETL
ncbi:hypothetical protein Leryth_021666 [Lithospermum erythrorhizon]|nr:hypothetical protein Leryth_021666 [Lithospermum erythrorhizon]